MIAVTVNSASLTKFLQDLQALESDATPVMRAVGTTLKSITEGNFNSVGASYRPAPWPSKRDGKASNLQDSTTLAKSFTLTVGPDFARVGNPTVYAAIHQFGGTIRAKNTLLRWKSGGRWWSKESVNIPARPFFPITSDGELTEAAGRLVVRAAERTLARIIGVSQPAA